MSGVWGDESHRMSGENLVKFLSGTLDRVRDRTLGCFARWPKSLVRHAYAWSHQPCGPAKSGATAFSFLFWLGLNCFSGAFNFLGFDDESSSVKESGKSSQALRSPQDSFILLSPRCFEILLDANPAF